MTCVKRFWRWEEQKKNAHWAQVGVHALFVFMLSLFLTNNNANAVAQLLLWYICHLISRTDTVDYYLWTISACFYNIWRSDEPLSLHIIRNPVLALLCHWFLHGGYKNESWRRCSVRRHRYQQEQRSRGVELPSLNPRWEGDLPYPQFLCLSNLFPQIHFIILLILSLFWTSVAPFSPPC